MSRIIDDKPYDIELSDEEIYMAYCEQTSVFVFIDI